MYFIRCILYDVFPHIPCELSIFPFEMILSCKILRGYEPFRATRVVRFGGTPAILLKGKMRKSALLFSRARGTGPKPLLESSKQSGLSPSTQHVPLGTANTLDVDISVIQSPSSPMIRRSSNLFGSFGDLKCIRRKREQLKRLSRNGISELCKKNILEENNVASTIVKKPTNNGKRWCYISISTLFSLWKTWRTTGFLETVTQRTGCSNYPLKVHPLSTSHQVLKMVTFHRP